MTAKPSEDGSLVMWAIRRDGGTYEYLALTRKAAERHASCCSWPVTVERVIVTPSPARKMP